MARIATIIVATAVLAVPQAAAKEGPLVPAKLLGFIGQGRALSVVKLDASTLKPISKSVPTGSSQSVYVARSPGRGRRVVFSTNSAALRFLDLDTMRWDGRVAYPGRPAAALWNYANRLVTVIGGEVVVVDAVKQRTRTVRTIDGFIWEATTTRDRIVAVVAPIDGIGPAKLAVVDDLGRVRVAPVPQILVGNETLNNASLFRFESPALAVDPLGRDAVVISANGTVVEVRLDTLAATVNASRTPAMVRKNASGSSRTALWLNSTTIALTGLDASFDSSVQRSTPAGLTLIDTRDWSRRTLDSQTSALALPPYGNGCLICSGVLLAYGEDGIAGYDFDGRQRYRVLQGASTRPAFVAGSYAYLGSGTHYTIVDTFTGSVVHTVDTKTPTSFAAFAS
jgi:hypothetical protein